MTKKEQFDPQNLYSFSLLADENQDSITPEIAQERENLLNQFVALEKEKLKYSLGMIQYIASQTGCPNICDFCSQGAATDIWRLSSRSLRNLFSVLKTIEKSMKESGHDKTVMASAEEGHKPGVVFLYHDTDVASDPNMGFMVKSLNDDFDLKVRISTVGWSRHNKDLQGMHEGLARNHPQAFDGFRVSLTPYTDGVTERGDRTSREEYVKDIANLLVTYKPMIDTIGTGKNRFSVDMRFAPMIQILEEVTELKIGGHHIIQAGDNLLIGLEGDTLLSETNIVDFEDGFPIYSNSGQKYVHIRDNRLASGELDIQEIAKKVIAGGFDLSEVGLYKNVNLYQFANSDGPYYAINPRFTNDGRFEAFHIYPGGKRKAGINDATRYFLNTIVTYKELRGLQRRDYFESATWEDVDNILGMLKQEVLEVGRYSTVSSEHIENNIIPMVDLHIKILKEANLSPALFFDPGFTIDTGQIVNQGRAIKQFKGLVTQRDTPLTPHEERGYGKLSYSTLRGTVWKLAPVPDIPNVPISKIGLRNRDFTSSEQFGSITLTPLENGTLDPILAQAIIFHGLEVQRISLIDARNQFLLPGLREKEDI